MTRVDGLPVHLMPRQSSGGNKLGERGSPDSLVVARKHVIENTPTRKGRWGEEHEEGRNIGRSRSEEREMG
jgi:hypothetical protein